MWWMPSPNVSSMLRNKELRREVRPGDYSSARRYLLLGIILQRIQWPPISFISKWFEEPSLANIDVTRSILSSVHLVVLEKYKQNVCGNISVLYMPVVTSCTTCFNITFISQTCFVIHKIPCCVRLFYIMYISLSFWMLITFNLEVKDTSHDQCSQNPGCQVTIARDILTHTIFWCLVQNTFLYAC